MIELGKLVSGFPFAPYALLLELFGFALFLVELYQELVDFILFLFTPFNNLPLFHYGVWLEWLFGLLAVESVQVVDFNIEVVVYNVHFPNFIDEGVVFFAI